jgi:hypothetical protein
MSFALRTHRALRSDPADGGAARSLGASVVIGVPTEERSEGRLPATLLSSLETAERLLRLTKSPLAASSLSGSSRRVLAVPRAVALAQGAADSGIAGFGCRADVFAGCAAAAEAEGRPRDRAAMQSILERLEANELGAAWTEPGLTRDDRLEDLGSSTADHAGDVGVSGDDDHEDERDVVTDVEGALSSEMSADGEAAVNSGSADDTSDRPLKRRRVALDEPHSEADQPPLPEGHGTANPVPDDEMENLMEQASALAEKFEDAAALTPSVVDEVVVLLLASTKSNVVEYVGTELFRGLKSIRGRVAVCLAVLEKLQGEQTAVGAELLRGVLLPFSFTTEQQREYQLACTDLCERFPEITVDGLFLSLLSPSHADFPEAAGTTALHIPRILSPQLRANVVRELAFSQRSWNTMSPRQFLLALRLLKQHVASLITGPDDDADLATFFSGLAECLNSTQNTTKDDTVVAGEVASLLQKCLLKLRGPALTRHAAVVRQMLLRCVALGVSSSACKSALRKVDSALG